MRLAMMLVALVAVGGCSEPPTPAHAPPPADEPEPVARPMLEQAPPPRAVHPLDTPEGVIADIVSKLDAESRAKLRGMKKDDLALHHHEWGASIRNEYRLWSNGALLRRCAARAGYGEYPFIHPDSASKLIMEGVWEAVNAPGPMN